jgi:N-acyl homoserine lactone hydrolase
VSCPGGGPAGRADRLLVQPGDVPVHVQRAELAYGMGGEPEPERNGIFRVDYDDPRISWRQADGDETIAP